jgi:ferredoxin
MRYNFKINQAINKVWIERGCSTPCVLCEDLCPQVFKLNGNPVVIGKINYSDYEKKIREVAELLSG